MIPLILAGGGGAVIEDEGTFAWGINTDGMLATGDVINASSPVQILSDTVWAQLAVGGWSWAGGLKANGTAWSWGDGGTGGTFTGTDRSSPVQIGVATDWANLSFGYYGMSSLINEDGELYTWGGYNTHGQQARGVTTTSATPLQVGARTDWLKASRNSSQQVMTWVKTDGTLWGAGFRGRLADGQVADHRSSPVQLGTSALWTMVEQGFFSSAGGVLSDNKLFLMGRNVNGVCGLGNSDIIISIPTQVGSLTDWTTNFSMGAAHAVAIKSDNKLWSWGHNNAGQLGHGDVVNRSSPVQVGTDANWAKCFAGWRVTYAIKTNGSLWACGNNSFGQLGQGDSQPDGSTHRSVLTQIGTSTNWTMIYTAGKMGNVFGVRSNA